MNSEQLAQKLREENPEYLEVKVLEDGSVAAKLDLLFTRAIILGCNQHGYESRFCFSDRSLADQRFEELQSENDIPEGYVARR